MNHFISRFENEVEFLKGISVSYTSLIRPYCASQYDGSFRYMRLFTPKYNQLDPISLAKVEKCNVYVRRTLSRISWKIPILRPTLKCHKNPANIRPVISKRGIASIQVGKVICFALSKIK